MMQPGSEPSLCFESLTPFLAMAKRKYDDEAHAADAQDWDDLVLEFGSGGSRSACSVPLRMCSPVFNGI